MTTQGRSSSGDSSSESSGSELSNPPHRVDRLIVHQFDAAHPSPGGIDTCLRGICRYLPEGSTLAIVGVDAAGDVAGRKLGRWEKHDRGNGPFWFLPVARLDAGNQRRRLPHSLRVVLGTLRFYRRLPKSEWFQAHRMDTAWSLRKLLGKRAAYFVHTQEDGLTGQSSDSFWRAAAGIHKRLERSVVRGASQVVVFNDDYAETVRRWNPETQSSPTWFDPDLVVANDLPGRKSNRVIWVGRLEVPKDPLLAIATFKQLTSLPEGGEWELHLLGSGTLGDDVEKEVSQLPHDVKERVKLHGRTSPARVAELMAYAGVFLMTSHPGYEGYPRVLVEALASGLPAVVTNGSDTGNLVRDGINGYVTSRDPVQIANRILEATMLQRENARTSVASLSAPEVIRAIYSTA